MLSELVRDKRYPDELVNLYNPAYVAALIYLSGVNFQVKRTDGMPIFYAYILLPLLAVDQSRIRVPNSAKARLADWVSKNADVFLDFPARVLALRPFVASGLVFLKSRKLVEFQTNGNLVFTRKTTLVKMLSAVSLSSEHVRDELDRAPTLGRLLAGEGDTASVLAYFGLMP